MATEATEQVGRMDLDLEISGIDPKLLQQLSEDNVNAEIVKDELQHMSLSTAVSASTIREKLVLILRHSAAEGVKLALILLDAILILAIIILDVYIVEAELEEKEASGTVVLRILKARCDNSTLGLLHEPITLDEAFASLTVAVEQSGDLSYIVGSVQQDGSHYHSLAEQRLSELRHWVEGLHYASIAILSLFVVELLLKIVGHGKRFVYYKLEIVDGVVILASLAIDIFLTNQSIQDLTQALLVIFLMWRLIRIFNGMMLTTKARTNFRIRVLKKAVRSSGDRIRELQNQVSQLEQELRSTQLHRMMNTMSYSQLDAASIESVSSKSTMRSLKSLMKSSVSQSGNWGGKLPRSARKVLLVNSAFRSRGLKPESSVMLQGIYRRSTPNGLPNLSATASELILTKLDAGEASPGGASSAPVAVSTDGLHRRNLRCHQVRKRASSEADLTQDSASAGLAAGVAAAAVTGARSQPLQRRGSLGDGGSGGDSGAKHDAASFDLGSEATTSAGMSRQNSYDLSSLDTGVSLTSLGPSSPERKEASNSDRDNGDSVGCCADAPADGDNPAVAGREGISSLQRGGRRERKSLTWCVDETIPVATALASVESSSTRL